MPKATILLVLLSAIPARVSAQSPTARLPRYELGLQFDVNYLSGVDDWGGGGGFRFHHNFDEHFALDSELVFRQHLVEVTPFRTGTIAQTTGLFGLRAGQRLGRAGLFVHARAGFLHFGSADGVSYLTRETVPAFDVGATVERYSGPAVFRLDVGEMLVAYGNAAIPAQPFQVPPGPSPPLGTRVSPAVGVGVAFRF